jgi:hypothetical protein
MRTALLSFTLCVTALAVAPMAIAQETSGAEKKVARSESVVAQPSSPADVGRGPATEVARTAAPSNGGIIRNVGIAFLGAACALVGAGAALVCVRWQGQRGLELQRIRTEIHSALEAAARQTDGRLQSLQKELVKVLRLVQDINSGVNSLGTAFEAQDCAAPASVSPLRQTGWRHPLRQELTYGSLENVTEPVASADLSLRGAEILSEELITPLSSTPADRSEIMRKALGRDFVAEIKAMRGQDFGRIWESFLAKLRARYADIDASELYWDRTAIGKFVERQLTSFRDTGKCQVLRISGEQYLFFPELAASARKVDLPYCSINSSDAILSAENLLEFVPPRVAQATDCCSVVHEGEIKYR